MLTARRAILLVALLALLAGCTRYVEVAPDVVVVDGARQGSVHYVNHAPLWPTYWWAWGGWPCHGWVGWGPCSHRYTSLFYPYYGWSPVWRSPWYQWHYGMAPREPWVYEPPFNDPYPDGPGGAALYGPWLGAGYTDLDPVIRLSPGWEQSWGTPGARAFEDRWFGGGGSVSGLSVQQRRVQPIGVTDPTAGMVVRSRSGGKTGSSRTQPPPRQSRPTSIRATRATRPATRSTRPSRSATAPRTTVRVRQLKPER